MAAAAQAAVVSWNPDNGNGPVAPTDTAGVVPATDWTTSGTGAGTLTNLPSSGGGATTVDLAWTTQYGPWRIQGSDPGLDAGGTANKRMLNGYLNSQIHPTDPNQTGTSTFTISDILATTTTPYDVIVYFSSDTAGRVGNTSNGTQTYHFTTAGPASISGPTGLFVPAVGLTPETATVGANYAIFTGLTGDTQTFTGSVTSGGGITGFQLVTAPIPEPATAAVVLGGIGMLVRRRRARRVV